MRHAWALLVLGMAAVGVGGVPARSWAHPTPTTTPVSVRSAASDDARATWTSAQSGAAGALLALASVTLCVALVPRHRRARPMRRIALALLVVTAGFDGAIHSVHHLDDPASADRCPVAGSAEHLSAAGVAGPPIVVCVTPALDPAPLAPPAVVRGVPAAPVAGRAPPR